MAGTDVLSESPRPLRAPGPFRGGRPADGRRSAVRLRPALRAGAGAEPGKHRAGRRTGAEGASAAPVPAPYAVAGSHGRTP